MFNRLFQITYSPNRIYGLDLLRAFAILSVMLAHGIGYVPKAWRYGYQFFIFDGVTIFFVLSGFLIGGILIKTAQQQQPTLTVLKDFWVKRWVRTIPPYFLILTLVCLLDSLHYIPVSGDFRLSIVWRFYLFIQNLRKPQAYFFQEAWSLSVEEWFYLLVPSSVFALLALKVKPSRAMLLVATALLISVTVYRGYKYLHYPAASLQYDQEFRKIVITRLDSLMYGVLGAYWSYYHPVSWLRYNGSKLAFGIVLLLTQQAILFFSPNFYWCVLSFSVMSLATLLMLPALSQVKAGKGRVARAFTHISLISYSMYLLNATVLNIHVIEPGLKALGFAPDSQWFSLLGTMSFWGLTLALSTLLYKYFEVPVMNLRARLLS